MKKFRDLAVTIILTTAIRPMLGTLLVAALLGSARDHLRQKWSRS